MMNGCQSLGHTRWKRKNRVVFIPKRRRMRIFGVLCWPFGEVFQEVAGHKKLLKGA